MKAAILLAGCGVFDGSEVHESVLLLLALTKKGYEVDFFSLDIDIVEPINHFTKEPLTQTRSMMEEASRISRGNTKDLKTLNVEEYDLVGMPGGTGPMNNFSNWGEEGADCTVNPDVARVIRDFFEAKKAIIGMCIAPMILGKILEGSAAKMTAGTSDEQLEILASMGIEAVSCQVHEACIDETNKIYTVPAYMEPPDIFGIFNSLERVMEAL